MELGIGLSMRLAIGVARALATVLGMGTAMEMLRLHKWRSVLETPVLARYLILKSDRSIKGVEADLTCPLAKVRIFLLKERDPRECGSMSAYWSSSADQTRSGR